ncbi:hypothetical protein C8J56DRAFT_78414 [Mycena floridula]|nr:hypothetical protein C8J56DRAFT_78414 [Mycena floridula]
MASQIFLVRDDTAVSLGSGNWGVSQTGTFWYDGSTSFPDTSALGSFSFEFEGIAVALWGNTGPTSQDFQVSIDNGSLYNTSTTDTSPQNWMQWYQSPVLEEGIHTIAVSGLHGTAIDLLLISPGPNTSLRGKTLLVDDSYSGIVYGGSSWREIRGSKFREDPPLPALPVQNGTHQTSTVGNSLTFSYTGTSMQLYGILQAAGGSLQLSYTIDSGNVLQETHTPDLTTPFKNDVLNYMLVDTGPLEPGNHTVVVQLAATIDQSLIVDYIQYQPGFDTLATMPNLSDSVPTPSTSSESFPSPSSGSTPSSPKTKSPKVLAGVTIGVVLVVVLLAASLFYLIRRRRRRQINKQLDSPLRPRRFEWHPPARVDRQAPGQLGKRSTNMREIEIGLETSSSPVSAIAVGQRQEELTRQLRELQELLLRSRDSEPGSGSNSTESGRNTKLRRRIEALEAENARLARMSMPPAYDEM